MNRDQQLYLDGVWVAGAAGTITAHDRWSGAPIGSVAVADAAQAAAAVDAAARAQAEGLPVHRRGEILDRLAALVEARAEDLAQLIRAEVGKPITAARTEASRAAGVFRIAAEESRRLPAEVVPLDAVAAGAGTFAFTIAEPRGVVAAITPFNFPLNLVAHKLGPAIAAGNAVVLKPAGYTPLTAGLLVELFAEAGLPAGWLNLVTGPAKEIVDVWQQDPRVAVITFTGSSGVGWSLKAASPRKLHILELGSNTAMVVADDADLDRAAADAVAAGFANSGQACISLQRIYVTAGAAEAFAERLAAAVAAVPAGDPNAPATIVGPLISERDTARVLEWVDAAVERGARLLAGGNEHEGVVQPTLLADAPPDAAVVCQEVFGPVITLTTVPDLESAISAVNASDYALNTSIYTASLATADRYARAVEAGSVLTNMPPSFRADHMPYGGVKDSGQGREGVRYAIEELVRQKLVILKP